MSEARNALIIANYRYEHPDLRQLLAPAQDAESLARVLSDPAIGGFEVRTVINEPSHKVSLEIEGFCDNRKRDDLLLLYFSGHGIKDADGQLYFATIDTQLVQQNVRRATAVSASFVNEVMSRSRSRRQILLLDCCYSGAFKEGMLAKGGKRVGASEQLEGQGRIVLTASDALQYSFEGGQVQGEGVLSIFTRTLVRGLETGEADLDRDGSFSLDEVYDYVHGKVVEEQPEQRPTKMGYVEGKIFIGNNPRPMAAELPAELQQSLDNPLPWVRKGAVDELEKLLKASNKGLVLAAHAALTSLATGDDSQEVRTKATKSLAAYADVRSPKAKDLATEWKDRPLQTKPELSTATGPVSRVRKHDKEKDRRANADPAVAATSTHATDPAVPRKEEPRPLEVSERKPTPIAVVSQPESAWGSTKKKTPKWAALYKNLAEVFAFLVVAYIVTNFIPQKKPSQTKTEQTQHFLEKLRKAREVQLSSSTPTQEHTSAPPLTTQRESQTNQSPLSSSTQKHTSTPTVATQHESKTGQPTGSNSDIFNSDVFNHRSLIVVKSTWTNSDTGLMWSTPPQEVASWDDATSYCVKLRLDGYSDWRLPTIDELEKMCDPTKTRLTSLRTCYVKSDEKKEVRVRSKVWSSTTRSVFTDMVEWLSYDFYARTAISTLNSLDSTGSALCVRGSGRQSSLP